MSAEDNHRGCVWMCVPHTIVNIQQQSAHPCDCMVKVFNAKPETSAVDQENFSK